LAGDQLQGFGGCNALMGAYTLEGTKLSFSSIGSTKKYCEGIQPTENAVKEMLGKVDSFRLDDNQLRLLGGGKELAQLRGE
ncbi:MAG TPA: META domain-containing protein, partial [Flavobacteriales bacterium]|nr:META domain-containing protein [Flavobacteriales bacterium]